MSCGLGEEELFILYVLYRNTCLRPSGSFHSKRLEQLYSRKFNDKIKSHIQLLKNDGYITAVRKKEIKYYISDITITSYALRNHGFNVTKGKQRPL